MEPFEIYDLLEEVLDAYREKRYRDALRIARAAAAAARSAGYGELEFKATLFVGVLHSMEDDWEAAFVALTPLVVGLERTGGEEMPLETALQCYFSYVYAASAVLPREEDVLATVDAAVAYCGRRGAPEHSLRFEHARSRVLSDWRRFDAALQVGERALARRRTADDEVAGCDLDCYVASVAEALVGLGEVTRARRVVNDALRAEPTSARLRRMHALVEVVGGRYRAALQDYDAALALEDGTDTLLLRAVAHAHLGSRDAALADLRQWREREPESVGAAVWIAALTGERRWLDGPAPKDRWERSQIRYLRGELDEAELLREAERRPRADYPLARAWLLIGMEADRVGDAPRARDAYARCAGLAARTGADYLWALGRGRQLQPV